MTRRRSSRYARPLSLVARWWLLTHDVFPLARDELSEQLSALGQRELAAGLHSCIHGRPPAAELQSMVAHARMVVEARAGVARPSVA